VLPQVPGQRVTSDLKRLDRCRIQVGFDRAAEVAWPDQNQPKENAEPNGNPSHITAGWIMPRKDLFPEQDIFPDNDPKKEDRNQECGEGFGQYRNPQGDRRDDNPGSFSLPVPECQRCQGGCGKASAGSPTITETLDRDIWVAAEA
jgi:hypothetical protein